MRRFVLAAMATVMTAGPAIAQVDGPPIGSRLGERLKTDNKADEETSALTAHNMAYCLVERHTRAARAVLASTEPGSFKKIGTKALGELQCAMPFVAKSHVVEGLRIQYPPDVMRGMLAEYLLKKDKAAARALPALPRVQIYKRPWFAATERHIAVDEMATCVSEVDPAGTLAVLETRPYSPDERAAIGRLMPAMGPCLSAGAKLQANRQALRAALAEALYQRTQPWPVTPPEQAGAAK